MNEELPEKISGGSDDPDICDLSPLKRHEWEAQIPLSPPSKKPLLYVKTREVSSVMSITMTMELAAAAVSLWKRHMLICLRDAVQDPRKQIEGFRDRPQIKRFSGGMNVLQIRAEIEYITDMARIMEYGIMSTPALMVDNKVVSMGRVLKAKEVAKML